MTNYVRKILQFVLFFYSTKKLIRTEKGITAF